MAAIYVHWWVSNICTVLLPHSWLQWLQMWHICVYIFHICLSSIGIDAQLGNICFWHTFGTNMWSIYCSGLCFGTCLQIFGVYAHLACWLCDLHFTVTAIFLSDTCKMYIQCYWEKRLDLKQNLKNNASIYMNWPLLDGNITMRWINLKIKLWQWSHISAFNLKVLLGWKEWDMQF